ncbi:dTDP-glucose 4,6-dehydratase [Pseudorhizobium halotolerans]|uniref:dTDP-glucose 4,6-dehydratase n=1 Tax=Pseudorhizobium halotolerans TaxID=1233081 RepID=A0ABM8PWI3_9HYPH|nr:dTDP-glucose 4,6-dehydratase [Pseudorhizobium halotolerans]CAD7052252.1 dTDP-glucose 4,6-dehydratase [Pseudorhizobium halotolerans]
MRIVVTGGAGFIGSAVVRHLIQVCDTDVLVIDKLTYAGNLASLSAVAHTSQFNFIRADICETERVLNALVQFRPQAILHLAAESHVDRSINGAADFVQTNIVGTFSLLEAARRYRASLDADAADAFRFVHVSTDEVYGSLSNEGLFTEESSYDPSSPYSASKAASDHLAFAWHRTYGLPVIVTNCSNNYGAFQYPEKLIPLMILNAVQGRALPIYGNGSNVRDWLHVDDHARALGLIAAHGRPGARYNVGGRNERSNLQVVNQICAIMDELMPMAAPHSRLIRFVEDRPGHDARYAIDAFKLELELGWQAQEDFESGLYKTVKWFTDNPWWWQPLRDSLEPPLPRGVGRFVGGSLCVS